MLSSAKDGSATRTMRNESGPDALDALMVALHTSPYIPLRTLDCSEHDGVLSLSGCVPSYYVKQVAQSLALAINNSWLIQNQIEVVSPGSRYSLRGAACGSSLSAPTDSR